MKETNLGIIPIQYFNGKLLIAIEEKWKDFFEDVQTFEVVIKDKRFSLLGPTLNFSPNRNRRTPAKEDKHV
jgi:hypothetical protein